MRLFKANQPQSEEDRAASLRLSNIASRYRVEPEADVTAEAAPESAETRQEPDVLQ